MIYAKVSELPDVLRYALERLNYNRKDIAIEAKEKISPLGPGGAGRREFCMIINMNTGEEKVMRGSWGGANMFNQDNQVDLDGNEYPIPEGFAVIKGSEGDGVSASLYLHPSNLAPMLKHGEQLDPRDRWVLYTFGALTSAGRKDEWRRRGDIPSEDDLNRLAARGYLKRSKNGATQITTDGKNALGRKPGETIYHPKSR